MKLNRVTFNGLLSIALMLVAPSAFSSAYSVSELKEALYKDAIYAASKNSELLFREAPAFFSFNDEDIKKVVSRDYKWAGGNSASLGLYPNPSYERQNILVVNLGRSGSLPNFFQFVEIMGDMYIVLSIEPNIWDLLKAKNIVSDSYNPSVEVDSFFGRIGRGSPKWNIYLPFPDLEATIENQIGEGVTVFGEMPSFPGDGISLGSKDHSSVSSQLRSFFDALSDYGNSYRTLAIGLPNNLRAAKLVVEHIFNMSVINKSVEKTIADLATPISDYACKKALARGK